MGKYKKSAALIAMMAATGLTVSASEELLEVEAFTGVSIGTGMAATITCGSSNTVTLKGDSKVLKKIDVVIKGDLLDIERKESAGSFIGKLVGNNKSDGSVKIDIVTTSALSLLNTSTGATMKVEDCAIDTNRLTIDASTGSTLKVNGVTTELILDMSTGSTFNHRGASFTVENARVDLSTGATANLCGATTVTGDASTGATVYVGEATDASGVDLSIGAGTPSHKCK